MTAPEPERDRTIRDFGTQWTRYRDNEGYYASPELFADILAPLMAPDEVTDCRVAEIGSGSGRIVRLLAASGAASITALEPSEAMAVLRRNTAELTTPIEYLQAPGEALPPAGYDLVFSIGVIHHIPDPRPVLAAAWRSLRPGGRLFVWVYGEEGNETYLRLVRPLRQVTSRLPAPVLAAVAWLLAIALSAYAGLCRLPGRWPLRDYLREVIAPLTLRARQLVVFDQLNPTHAVYYRREQLEQLLIEAGFGDVRLHHRHGYSWSAIGRRPQDS